MALGNISLAPVPTPGTPDELFAAEQNERPPIDPASVYWAGRMAKDVLAELDKKERAYFDFAQERWFTPMSRIAFAQYHGLDPTALNVWATQQVALDGDQGELLRFRVNESRSFIKQVITMAIGNRPSFECSATNTDYDSLGQAETADAIVEYMYQRVYGERKERVTIENGALYGLGWSWCNWDPNAGEMMTRDVPVMRTLPDGSEAPALDPLTGKPKMKKEPTGQRTGDIVMKSLAWWQVFHEPRVDEPEDHLWRCVREKRSKHEIIGRFPEHREKLLALKSDDLYSLESLFGLQQTSGTSTDEIVVKHFYHKPSDALHEAKTDRGEDASHGRYILYAGECVLLDLPLQFPVIPLVDFCPAEYKGTSFGYADSWDLFAINQMLDQIVSDVASNLSAFGRQCIWGEEGLTDSDSDAIANGMRVLLGRPGSKPPQAIQLAALPAGWDKFLEYLGKRFQSLSGLNSVTRGDPDASITSGTMAALFHSIAIEFNSALQAAVDSHRERLANLILDILKVYAEHPLIVKIAGADERPYADTFTRDKLLGVSGVQVKTSNPMMRTQAGRLQIAEMMMKMGSIKDPVQLLEVIVSGQFKPAYDADRKLRMKIKLENELLQEGPPVKEETPPAPPALPNGLQPPPPKPYKHVPTVPVHWLDDHDIHVAQHHSLLASREAMSDPALREAVNVHIDHHMKVWRETDPAALLANGKKPFPQPMAPPGARPAGPPPMQRIGKGGPPANTNDKGPPEAMKPTDQPKQREESAGTPLPKPAQSPMAGKQGAA
jgi:hypothetical protein